MGLARKAAGGGLGKARSLENKQGDEGRDVKLDAVEEDVGRHPNTGMEKNRVTLREAHPANSGAAAAAPQTTETIVTTATTKTGQPSPSLRRRVLEEKTSSPDATS